MSCPSLDPAAPRNSKKKTTSAMCRSKRDEEVSRGQVPGRTRQPRWTTMVPACSLAGARKRRWNPTENTSPLQPSVITVCPRFLLDYWYYGSSLHLN